MSNVIHHSIKIPDHVERIRLDWRMKLIATYRGNQTPTGLVLLALFGKAPDNPPRIVSQGIIDENGGLWALFQHAGETVAQAKARHDLYGGLERLGHIEQVRDAMRRVADRAKLSDAQREELIGELRKFIDKDLRQGPSLLV